MASQIPLDRFESTFGTLIELSSVALGGSIVSVSDEFFADASNLLSVPPALSMKGQFGPKGALFDGWESRRHNPTYDWVIIKLGAEGFVHGVDIDTANFSGNESPASGVEGVCLEKGETIEENSPLWAPLVPTSPLGPSSRHLFLLTKPFRATHLKLTMVPDGGIGRFRAYGTITSSSSSPEPEGAIDFASVLNGARVTGESDQHFGKGANLILPGRGKDMGDGWETKRSRGRLGKGLGDWVVIKLGEPGYCEWIDIDTLHFVGNFPESAEVYGIVSDKDLPPQDADWTLILDRTKLGPHRQHFFQLTHPEKAWTHVRLSIYPDGGVKRVRVHGRRSSQHPAYSTLSPLSSPEKLISSIPSATTMTQKDFSHPSAPRVPALPLTPDAFSKFGSVIQSYPDHRSARKDVVVKSVNFGTAFKFNHLAPVSFIRPPSHPELKGEINFCVFRCEPQDGLKVGDQKRGMEAQWDIKALERHEFSSQSFVPMGGGGGRYLVVVALPGQDGHPDLSTLRAFIATSSQGISYHPNIWHHPLIALEAITDFACVVYETGSARVDSEIVEWKSPVAVVHEDLSFFTGL